MKTPIAKSKPYWLIAGALLTVGLIVVVLSILRGTAMIRAETRKVRIESGELRTTSAHYSKEWDKKLSEKERHLSERLPMTLNATNVLEQFVTRFEQANPRRAVFLSVVRQNPTLAGLAASVDHHNAIRPRAVRYRIKSELGIEQVIPYFEQIEKFSEAFQVDELELSVARNDLLRMNLVLEFYLAPEEWSLPPGKLEAKRKSDGHDGKLTLLEWKSVSWVRPRAPSSKKTTRKLASISSANAVPEVAKLFGGSAVIGENVYEEGDKVQGWSIAKIDPSTNTVTFRKNKLVRKVVIK